MKVRDYSGPKSNIAHELHRVQSKNTPKTHNFNGKGEVILVPRQIGHQHNKLRILKQLQ